MGSALPLLGGDVGSRTYLEMALTLTGRDKMASVLQGAGSQPGFAACFFLLHPLVSARVRSRGRQRAWTAHPGCRPAMWLRCPGAMPWLLALGPLDPRLRATEGLLK